MENKVVTSVLQFIDNTRGLKESVAGTTAGIAGTSIGHPLDTIKVYFRFIFRYIYYFSSIIF